MTSANFVTGDVFGLVMYFSFPIIKISSFHASDVSKFKMLSLSK